MKKIIISLDIKPHGQERSRFTCRGGTPVPFKSKTQQFAEKQLEEMLQPFVPQEPMVGALYLNCIAIYPMSKTKQCDLVQTTPLDKYYKEPYIKKPDVDNIAKHIMDCMTRTGFFEDDRQIVHQSITKIYDDVKDGKLIIELGCYNDCNFEQIFRLLSEAK